MYYYDYSSNGNLISEEQFTTGNTFLQGQYYTYNSYGDVATSTLKVAGMAPIKYVCKYGYESVESNQKLSVYNWEAKGSGYEMAYGYDSLGRLVGQHVYPEADVATSSVLTRSYSYLAGTNGGTTGLVSGVTYSGKSISAYTYTYDARGNITAVYKGGTLQASYAYDDLNQLVRENNVTAGKTWVYTYDKRGNILSRKTYAYTTGTLGTVQDTDTYEYFDQSSTSAWGDVLLRYDGIEYNVYDAIGNPTRYMNVNESGAIYTFSWQNGRQLASGTKGLTNFAYTYNADGLRTQKVVNGVTTTYYWAGSQLAAMTIDNGTTVKTLKFYYNAEGRPMCLDYNGAMYFYITNLQGDVVALADQYGEVIRYEYDAWGKPIVSEYYFSSHSEVMQNNPLRYRGYIYDSETGFYYLQSRYYDPAVGRFINVDGVGYLGATGTFLSFNLFAYCENNPVMCLDPNGHVVISTSAIITTLIIGAIIGGGIAAGATAYEDYSDDGEVFNGSVGLDEYAGNTLGGVIAGAGTAVCSVLGAGLGVALVAGETALTIGGCAISGATAFGIGVGSSFVAGGLGYTARTAVNQKESFEFSDMLIESGANAVTGALTFAGATVGGICGVQIPGESSNFGNLSKYHIGLAWFGVYPTKILISCIKGKLKEDY